MDRFSRALAGRLRWSVSDGPAIETAGGEPRPDLGPVTCIWTNPLPRPGSRPSEGSTKEPCPLGSSNSKLGALRASVQAGAGHCQYKLEVHQLIKCVQCPIQERWSRNNCHLHLCLGHPLFLDPGGQGSDGHAHPKPGSAPPLCESLGPEGGRREWGPVSLTDSLAPAFPGPSRAAGLPPALLPVLLSL